MNKKYALLISSLVSVLALTGCQSNADSYAADVYETSNLNGKQETKTVNLISILPAKISVDNTENKKQPKRLVPFLVP